MRFLANENFPLDAVEALRQNGHDVAWIISRHPFTFSWFGCDNRSCLGKTDRQQLEFATSLGRCILTHN